MALRPTTRAGDDHVTTFPAPTTTPADPLAWLGEHARKREAAGLRRRLRPRAEHTGLVDLAGNDYLGLARDPRIRAAAAEAARVWGGGSTGSRLVTGTTDAHVALEG
ncbi:MAG: 8-amino-7-oxononanoate synthase, partial [Actinocrinis sp.]